MRRFVLLSFPFIFYLSTFILSFLLASCAQPTGSTDGGALEQERIEVSGSVSEDTLWETGKEYYVTEDVIVESGVTLTIQPDVWVLFKKESQSDYYGITVEGTLLADGGDSTTAILFTSGAPEWARKPGDWRGIEVEASSDSSSVIRYCRIAYANVGIKADRSSPRVSYCVVQQCADTGILFNGSVWGAVLGCTVRENAIGIRFELVKDGVIERCTVVENEDKGIECKTSSPDIEDNLMRGNGWGIYCHFGASPGIRWNTLVDQRTGEIRQFVDSFSEITDNLIVQHTGDGIVIDQPYGALHIRGNNLISKSNGYAIRLNAVKAWAMHPDVEATENYWGSGNPVEIEAKIYDGMDTWATLDPKQYYHALVVFEPFAVDSIHAAGLRLLRD